MPRRQQLKSCLYCTSEFFTTGPEVRFCSQKCGGLHRFWGRIQKTDTCWIWGGCVDDDGYGVTSQRTNGVKLNKRCHVLTYEMTVGPVPAGLVLDHTCRNRACVNPDHLEPVTNLENVLRGEIPWIRLQQAEACVQGHPYTPENTKYRKVKGKLVRQCRTCVNVWKRGATKIFIEADA